MMNTRTYKIVALILLLTVWACSPEVPENEPFPEADQEVVLEDATFGSIAVKPVAGNSLRRVICLETPEPCNLHVEFWKADEPSKIVRSKVSSDKTTHEIPLIFMVSESRYLFQVIAQDGRKSSVLEFHTGSIDPEIQKFIGGKEPEGDFHFNGYLLYFNKMGDYGLMIDDRARIVWYERFSPLKCLSFSYDKRSQTMSFMHGQSRDKPGKGCMTCIDFYGNRLLEAPAEVLDHPMMHHDVYRMADGNWIYTHFVDREFDFTPLGIPEMRGIRGDGLSIINDRHELLWEWNCFDHLDPLKDPDLLKTEHRPVIHDWLHTNSIIEDPEGNLLISCNRPKQFMKIDRQTGEVLYRLGYNGNVRIESEQQHECSPDRLHSLELGKDGEIHLYENGDRDREYSRVLSYRVNETDHTARCLNSIQLTPDMRSSYNGSAYEIDDRHYVVHSTEKTKTIIIEKTGHVVWSKPINGLSFRAIYIPKPEL